MLLEIPISPAEPTRAVTTLLDAWRDPSIKVVVLRNEGEIPEVRNFYEDLFPLLGTPRALAEDVTVGGRDEQRTGEIWMEIRYDPAFPDAYRHSPNPQPLHTDGSYIPNFPNSSLLACVSNADDGGETTFIDVDDVISSMEVEDPELLEQLRSTLVPHSRSGDRRESRVLEEVMGRTKIYWNYYCVAGDIENDARSLADRFHSFLLNSPRILRATIATKLRPGDGVLWKDDEVLHGRNAFVAHDIAERFIWKCAFDVGVFEGQK
jgi:alpha-ketoglutarate-dependent taurine dioxygenase